MGGIVGFVSGGDRISASALSQALKSICHRGPDRQGRWIAPDGRAGLAQARIGVEVPRLPLPLASEDGRYHVATSGRLHDHAHLRADLARTGSVLGSNSDAEIALHLYAERGVDCLDALRGEFAFAIWDDLERVLFAARDRLGCRPLLYARIGDVLYLASEAKALFAAGVPAAWDEDAVFGELVGQPDRTRTLFRNVREVPPGHYLIATPTTTRVVRYWNGGWKQRGSDLDAPIVSDREAVEVFRDELLEATRVRLAADVPLGSYLDGRIESAAVLGIASQIVPHRMDAFAVSVSNGENDRAARAADYAGARLHTYRITDSLCADVFEDAVWHGEALQWDGGVAARYLLGRKARDYGVGVVLTGDGTCDVLAGPAPGRSDQRCASRVRGLMRGCFSVRAPAPGGESSAGFDHAIDTMADRIEMAHALERRSPFLDHQLLEAVGRMVPDGPVRDGVAELILREAVRPFVMPDFERCGEPSCPAPRALCGRMRELANDTLRGESLRSQPFFDPTEAIALLDATAAPDSEVRAHVDSTLFAILSICLLERRFGL